MDHRREIDGLRAVAVIAVILNHLNRDWLPSGFLGVDIFFVISGYVITASLHGRQDRTLGSMLLDFYVRRMKRLLPAVAVFVAVTAVLISLFDPSPGQPLTTGLFSLLGLANLHLIAVGADYFGDSVLMNPFTHTWSLGVEEQFYLLYPALAWAVGVGATRHRARAMVVLGGLCALSLAAFVGLAGSRPDLSYYLMPARFWELGAGALLYWAGLAQGRRVPGWMASVALAALVLVLFLPERLQVASTILACALTVVVIGGSRTDSGSVSVLTSGPLVFIGLISYSLYLWHWGLLVIARWTLGLHWWSIALVLAATFAAATLSYRWVELPARRARWSASRARELALGSGAALALVTLVAGLASSWEGRLYAGKRPMLAKMGVETLIDSYTVAGTTWSGLPCVLTHNEQAGREIPVDRCTLGDFEGASKRVLVIGNSFAASFTAAFDQLVQEDGYAVTIAAAWGASPAPELPNRTLLKRVNDHYWRAVVPGLVDRLREGDKVLVVADLADFSPAQASDDSGMQLAQLGVGLDRLSRELAERGISLAVLHGNPLMREANCNPAMAASQWFSPAGRPCKYLTREATLQRRAALDRVLTNLQASGRLTVIDLMDLFCPDRVCHFEARDGTLLYRDMHSHPSQEAARMAAGAIRRALLGAEDPAHPAHPDHGNWSER